MARITVDQLPPGTVVRYRPENGRSAPTLATVVYAEEDGKNGQAVADLELPDGGLRWAYLHQIDAIISTPEEG